MKTFATVVIAGNSAAARGINAVLTNADFGVTIAHGARAAALVAGLHPDIVLVDQDGMTQDPVEFGSAIKSAPPTAEIPVVIISDDATPQLQARAFDAGLDGVIPATCPVSELLARLRPLVRLAVLHSELQVRSAVAERFGVIVTRRSIQEHNENGKQTRPRILILGDEAKKAAAGLADESDLTEAANIYEAEDFLSRSRFDAAIVANSGNAETAASLCTQVRHNPSLFNLPIAVLGDGMEDYYHRGASWVLPPGVEPGVVRDGVMTLVRRQQLRWAIRNSIAESLAEPTRDPCSTLYSRAFLEAYLEERVALANSAHRHLTVAFLSAPNIDSVRREFGDDAALHLTTQVGQWITGLLRIEDVVARYTATEFCVVLPDTATSEADVVLNRIAGVIAYSDFAVRDVYQPIKVWLEVESGPALDADNLASLIKRIRKRG